MAEKVFDTFFLIPIEEYQRLIKCQAATAKTTNTVAPPGIPQDDKPLEANGLVAREDPITRDDIIGAGWLEQWTALE